MPSQYLPQMPTFTQTNFATVLTQLGLTTGLKLHLDAGDASSYTSGQKWLDLTSGGYDFFRGTDATAQASDPTFNGVAGTRSSAEYWSFDGGDSFRYDSANETWMNNIHKTAAKYSIALWAYMVPSAGTYLIGDTGGSAAQGFEIVLGTTTPQLSVLNNAANGVLSLQPSNTIVSSAWNFLGVNVDAAVSSAIVLGNSSGYAATTGSAYGTGAFAPSASDAPQTLEIGAAGNAAGRLANTNRIAWLAIWESTTIGTSAFKRVFDMTRAKYGV